MRELEIPNKNILILDDPNCMRPLKDRIETHNSWNVYLTNHIFEAKEKIKTGVDLLIYEPFLYAMPEGEKMFDLIHETKSKKIPIYACSTQTLIQLNEQRFRMGDEFDYFSLKPFLLKNIEKEIEKILMNNIKVIYHLD